jgi:hypothetical protein
MQQERHETSIATAERLTVAIAANDTMAMESIYAPTASIWHNTDQRDLSVPELLELLAAIDAVATADVAVHDRMVTDSGFVQTQVITYTFKDGRTTAFHAAMVAWVGDDGRITRIQEYLDGAGLQPLIDAITANAQAAAN